MARDFVTLSGCAVSAGSTILTLAGCVSARDLHAGDRIVTRDHGAQPVRDVDYIPISSDASAVAIPAGALGDNDPTIVAPSQRILIRNAMADLYFGENEVLATAENLVGLAGITTTNAPHLGFVRLEFDAPEIIYADGLEIESGSIPSFEWATDPLMSRLGLSISGMPMPPRPVLSDYEARLLLGRMQERSTT
jgi:hypothetical protein